MITISDNINSLNIQWFPGHMAKAKRLIKNSVKLVDAVVEVIDARIPISSRNPELDELTASKPRIIVLNKSDMADENATSRWIEFFKKNGSYALSMDSRNQKNAKRLIPVARQALFFFFFPQKGRAPKSPLSFFPIFRYNSGKISAGSGA